MVVLGCRGGIAFVVDYRLGGAFDLFFVFYISLFSFSLCIVVLCMSSCVLCSGSGP